MAASKLRHRRTQEARNDASASLSVQSKSAAYIQQKAYKNRVVERCFCRLKDFRRIATRYDKLAQKLLFGPLVRCYLSQLDKQKGTPRLLGCLNSDIAASW